MIPWQLGMQGNAAMYSNAHVWMQTFDSCCMYQAIFALMCLMHIRSLRLFGKLSQAARGQTITVVCDGNARLRTATPGSC